jgi:predicted O-methyltransferase YrrM
VKSIILKLLNKFGYEISKSYSYSSDGSYDPFCDIDLGSKKIVDLEALANISISIPGMVSPKSGQFLYTMCYMQQSKGDVVEVGSWQGRSTSFLARAVSNSKNGNFYAIDHFKGNSGKEKLYAAGKNDLSDLESNFLSNMERVGLSDSVILLNMPNEQAEREIKDINIRFLFIDGDHSKQGVEKDIELFFPKLQPGSIVVFDDFSNYFQGLVEAVDLLIREREFSRVMSYHNTLVLMV